MEPNKLNQPLPNITAVPHLRFATDRIRKGIMRPAGDLCGGKDVGNKENNRQKADRADQHMKAEDVA